MADVEVVAFVAAAYPQPERAPWVRRLPSASAVASPSGSEGAVDAKSPVCRDRPCTRGGSHAEERRRYDLRQGSRPWPQVS